MDKKVLILGGTGFIGKALGPELVSQGFDVHILTRSDKNLRAHLSFPCHIHRWNGQKIPEDAIAKATYIINLTGEPVFDRPWHTRQKRVIRESRVKAIKALQEALVTFSVFPKVVIQASAIGFLGTDSAAVKKEDDTAAGDFLAQVCAEMEALWQGASSFCQRMVIMRLGVVLGWEGGAWPRLHEIYATKLGARLGDGKQWMNFIALDDVIHFVSFALNQQSCKGVYHLVAPENMQNHEFHALMQKKFICFFKWKIPQFWLHFVLGERATAITQSPKVTCHRLLKTEFKFRWPNLNPYIESLYQGIENQGLVLKLSQWVPHSQEKIFAFMSDPNNLETITPPWLNFKIVRKDSEFKPGMTIDYRLTLYHIGFRWRTLIKEVEPLTSFTDVQIKGPYKTWNHQHFFKSQNGGVLIIDQITYQLPFGVFGNIALPWVKKRVHDIFEFRRQKIAEILESTRQNERATLN